MSAYPYTRMPPAPMAGPSKRYPLNTVNHNYVPMPKAPVSPKPAEKQHKAPSSPPLTRQNSKSVPPSPPKIIEDVQQGKQFQRTQFLGEVRYMRSIWFLGSLYAIGRLCKGLRSEGCKREAFSLQSCHQGLAQNQEGENQGESIASHCLFYGSQCPALRRNQDTQDARTPQHC